ncbi:MAG: sensor histidine kinase [Actinobacteria bacterium]|nr:sensor histidine kinase [Actinomycetota bacterium]
MRAATPTAHARSDSVPARRRWGVYLYWVAILAMVASTVVLTILNGPHFGTIDAGEEDEVLFYVLAVASVVYAWVGGLILARRPNAIGVLCCLIALGFALTASGWAYAIYGLVVSLGPLPGSNWAAWVGAWAGLAAVAALPMILLLFPDGHPPSRRWRPVLWAAIVAAAGLAAVTALSPGPIAGSRGEFGVLVNNPLGVAWSSVLGLLTFLLYPVVPASLVAPLIRYRRAGPEERQQLRWMALIPLALLVTFVLAIVASSVFPRTRFADTVGTLWWSVVPLAVVLAIPVAAAVAILRYRLYDLDVVVKKTVVFAVVAAVMTGMYILAVVAIPAAVLGTGGTGGLDAPTLIVAVLLVVTFPWVRARARRFADRVVYGGRATPYEVLSEFAERVGGTYSTDDVLPRMARLLAAGTGATEVRVWLRVAGELRPVTAWPYDALAATSLPISGDELPSFGERTDAFPVRHQGELLGAFTVATPANDPMNPSKERLVRDLAGQAGLVLRNVRLIEDLRDSRRRIVTAQDERAKSLERNIHDGAQQQLVALSVKLRLAQGLVKGDPDRAETMLSELQTEANDALDNLRDLARGIYPPLLADKGLTAALEAQARKSPVPVDVEADGVGRYAQEIEAAVYFCSLEALNNLAKYANASRASIRLATTDGTLTFEVTDDGAGFDPDVTGHGTGLQAMADRIEAIGGVLEVRSAPGQGTTVTGRVPAREEVPLA